MKRFLKRCLSSLSRTRVIGPLLIKVCSYVASTGPYTVVSYDDPKRSRVIDLIRSVHTETTMILKDCEAYQIYMAVERTSKVPGDLAEVGTYRGGSAKLICEAKGDRVLHVFDTFEGLPTLTQTDNPKVFHEGQFASSFEEVRRFLSKYGNLHLYKGLFPGTSEPIAGKRFSFVHLDVDLYESTLACLDFFYPRMSKGGVIISHDYIDTPGVRKAFDDFFGEKPEPIIEMSGSQCLVVKV
jgi:O-methyltransferase